MAWRIAVVGLGNMGRNHARVLADLEGADLVAVCDPASSAERFARRRLRAPYYENLGQMLLQQSPDAAIVAVPTSEHHSVARTLLEGGVHLLVEKPLAAKSGQAADLLAMAEQRGLHLAVGHVERCNPAVVELRRRLVAGELGRVFQIASRRRTPFPARVMDCGVAIDLATHDIDLMRHLLGDEPVQVSARTVRRFHPTHEDSLIALLTFRGGTVGVLEADWVTPRKIRMLEVTGDRGMFVVEHLSQELSFYQNGARAQGWTSLDNLVGVVEGDMTRFAVGRTEPLAVELASFLDLLAGRTTVLASGSDGLAAVRIAEEMLRAAASDGSLGTSPEAATDHLR
ncbi:MAG: Gfo/Idh/MocA family oxidoreductase [Elusimicrobia bacterium]|nr:Gfo/Idh/MocA family oxidoreductase [Elusimicrobiota bacterium]